MKAETAKACIKEDIHNMLKLALLQLVSITVLVAVQFA